MGRKLAAALDDKPSTACESFRPYKKTVYDTPDKMRSLITQITGTGQTPMNGLGGSHVSKY